MEIRTPNKFEPFADGVLEISYKGLIKHPRVNFSNYKLGYGRFFSARTAQTQIDRVVRIPRISDVSIYDTVIINGGDKYRIELIQPIDDSLPPSLQLTLKCLEVHN